MAGDEQRDRVHLRWERWWVAVLCAVAALRVFLCSAAFPVFNHVDEHAHYDLVGKYSRGHWPSKSAERYDTSSARLFTLYGSYEYLREAAAVAPPLWQQPPEKIQVALARSTRYWATRDNHEAQSPPVYYAVAGAWRQLGASLGFKEAERAYWVRFLNVFVYASLVWLAYLYCRAAGAGVEIRLGVPLLVAFFPQDVFYGINSDVLSPLLFTATLIGLSKWYRDDRPSILLGAVVGLGAVLTLLVKLTNIGLLVILGGVLVWRLQGSMRRGSWRALAPSATAAAAAATLPLGLWMLRNHLLFGDLTGNGPKVAHLGWSPKPWAALFDHPLFTLDGAWHYAHHVTLIFWRGEYVWHGKEMAHGGISEFYAYSSLLFLLAAAVAWVLRAWSARRGGSEEEGAAAAMPSRGFFNGLNWASVLLGFGCLAALSLRFEFANTSPSRAYPFFAAGRLAIGVIVPFAVLYVEGLAFILRPLRWARAPLVAVALLVAAITVSEVLLTLPVFDSQFNWFHLP